MNQRGLQEADYLLLDEWNPVRKRVEEMQNQIILDQQSLIASSLRPELATRRYDGATKVWTITLHDRRTQLHIEFDASDSILTSLADHAKITPKLAQLQTAHAGPASKVNLNKEKSSAKVDIPSIPSHQSKPNSAASLSRVSKTPTKHSDYVLLGGSERKRSSSFTRKSDSSTRNSESSSLIAAPPSKSQTPLAVSAVLAGRRWKKQTVKMKETLPSIPAYHSKPNSAASLSRVPKKPTKHSNYVLLGGSERKRSSSSTRKSDSSTRNSVSSSLIAAPPSKSQIPLAVSAVLAGRRWKKQTVKSKLCN